MNDFFQQLRLVCPSNREQCSPVIDWRVQIPRIPGEAVPNWQRVSDNNMMAVGQQTGLDLWTHFGKKGKQNAVRDHLRLQVKWDEYKQAEDTTWNRSMLLLMPVCSELYDVKGALCWVFVKTLQSEEKNHHLSALLCLYLQDPSEKPPSRNLNQHYGDLITNWGPLVYLDTEIFLSLCYCLVNVANVFFLSWNSKVTWCALKSV